ncbi:hypothetical protein F1880_000129 [Penicillium rolfsii]|nr:hypothetical protein F1880_000129 [Penicillium rolfsii]
MALWKCSSKDKTQRLPSGVAGVAKALIAISGHLGETHSSSTGRVAFVASALERHNKANHEIASTIARARHKTECVSVEQSEGQDRGVNVIAQGCDMRQGKRGDVR